MSAKTARQLPCDGRNLIYQRDLLVIPDLDLARTDKPVVITEGRSRLAANFDRTAVTGEKDS